MKFLSILLALCTLPVSADEAATPGLFELRDYHASEGRLDPLLNRFRDHTVKLFEKHGMINIGYWIPVENSERRFVYLRAFKDMDDRTATTGTFRKDPEWREALTESQKEGKLIDSIEKTFMKPTDFSPGFANLEGATNLFEMRTYIATDGNLPALHARFRDHTLALFAKHGMTSLAYFQLLPDQPGAENTLIYFLAHKDREAAKKSWQDFSSDPDWIAAKKASEEAAGGSLTKQGGVKSVFLKATDFSPVK